MNWHETFGNWSKPPSDSEEEKASKAADSINRAVRDTQLLAGRTFKVYPTGSYRNNTNIKLGSDVDIALVLTDAFFYTLPAGRRPEEFGLGGTANYGLVDFRRDVERALQLQFGGAVASLPKTFRIAGTTTRLPADATPFLQHREYTGRRGPDGSWEYHEGVELRPLNDLQRRIINWHDAHYARGVARNDATGRRFKRVARILKKLREDMKLRGTAEAKAAAGPAASFLLECLVYNAPNNCFNIESGSYVEDVKAVIRDAWQKTANDGACAGMQEVSERKLLFGSHQGWTRQQAHEFLLQAWYHVGFK